MPNREVKVVGGLGNATDEDVAKGVEYTSENGIKRVGTGRIGEDGGYYTPSVSQPDPGTMTVSFEATKDNMPNIPASIIELPEAKGATFTPKVDTSGNLSWTNDSNLANPIAVNIKGPKGDTGAAGKTPVRGTDYWTEADKAEIKSYVDSAILGGSW